MQLKQLLIDRDDAVSPVIGVILMVAITVILAAVIASFVLGFGPGATAPNSNFAFETTDKYANGTAKNVSVTHDGGETVQAENLYLDGSGLNIPSRVQWTNGTALAQGGETSGTKDGKNAVVTGDSAVVGIDGGADQWTIKVVWVSDDGSKSQELASQTGSN